MAYVRPSASDIDSWGEENAGWSWNDLEPYYLKHEDLQHPLNSTKNLVHLSSASHGQEGPIRLSMPPSPIPFEQSIFTGLENTSGIPRSDDPYGGQHIGAFESLSNIDRSGGQVRRSYSASAYLIPALERPNLKILTEASVSRIIFDHIGEATRASAVEFWHGGEQHKVKASQEIILSASTIQSPRILELSGIGNRAILQSAGIDPIVDLPAVGENLQEHPMTSAVYELVPDIVTMDSLFLDHNLLQQQTKLLADTQNGLLAGCMGLTGFLPYASQVPRRQSRPQSPPWKPQRRGTNSEKAIASTSYPAYEMPTSQRSNTTAFPAISISPAAILTKACCCREHRKVAMHATPC